MSVSHLPTNLFDNAPATTLSDDELSNRLTGYAGQIAALTARFLELLAEFDQRSAWNAHGILSCAHWLVVYTGLSSRTAQDHVRVARALTDLPELSAAFRRGELTYSKVRALTRAATPDNEPELLALATSATAAQIETIVRAMGQVDRRENSDNSGGSDPVIESSGRWRWNDDGSLSVTLRFSALDGAMFLAGVVRAEYERTRVAGDVDVPRNALNPSDPRPDSESDADVAVGPGVTAHARRDLWRHAPSDLAAAVLAMADTVRTIVDVPDIAPAAEVIVHTHTSTDVSGQWATVRDPHLDNGPALTNAEAAEAMCGGTVSDTVHVDGVRLWWGRDRRMPTRRLVRFITQRDQHCCQHPGCGRTRHLHIHHVRFWSKAGTTDPDNLIVLCSTHHRALHRGAFRIAAHGEQQFTFHTADGALLERAPAIGVPPGWVPDRGVRFDATVPVNGGRLDLAYTVEVLFRTADYRARQAAQVATEQPAAA